MRWALLHLQSIDAPRLKALSDLGGGASAQTWTYLSVGGGPPFRRIVDSGSAWFSFDEGQVESFVAGKYADLAVLSEDYLTVPEQRIRKIESVLTIVGGKLSTTFEPADSFCWVQLTPARGTRHPTVQNSTDAFRTIPHYSAMCRKYLQGLARATRAMIAAILVMHVLAASAQDVTEPSLKAAFIYNFAKFTEWPADAVPAAGPFVMCVVGDAGVSEALERAVKTRLLSGRSMDVSRLAPAGPQHVCHILYLSGIPSDQAARLVAGLRDVPVLTISDIQGFTDLGGIAQFFFEHGQLRFSVRIESARRARIQISAKLLQLAKPE